MRRALKWLLLSEGFGREWLRLEGERVEGAGGAIRAVHGGGTYFYDPTTPDAASRTRPRRS